MPALNVSVPHNLGQEAALARVQQFLDDIRTRYASHISDVRGQWAENLLEFAFTASGFPIKGTLSVDDDAVHVQGPLPLAAMFFKGKIEQTIRDELKKLLT